MTYAPAKFEAAMSNGVGGIAFIRNIWFDLVTWSIALYIMWPMYLQSVKLLRQMVKEMHYQENMLFDLDPKVKGVKVTRNVAQYPGHHVTYVPAKFDVAFTRKYIILPWAWVKVTRNVAQYPPHHVTYAPAKFDIATSHN